LIAGLLPRAIDPVPAVRGLGSLNHISSFLTYFSHWKHSVVDLHWLDGEAIGEWKRCGFESSEISFTIYWPPKANGGSRRPKRTGFDNFFYLLTLAVQFGS
jgi:hypothetical protein